METDSDNDSSSAESEVECQWSDEDDRYCNAVKESSDNANSDSECCSNISTFYELDTLLESASHSNEGSDWVEESETFEEITRHNEVEVSTSQTLELALAPDNQPVVAYGSDCSEHFCDKICEEQESPSTAQVPENDLANNELESLDSNSCTSSFTSDMSDLETLHSNTGSKDAVLLALFKKHNFSKSAKDDILKVLSFHSPQSECAKSAHTFEKRFQDLKLSNIHHVLCRACKTVQVNNVCQITNAIYTKRIAAKN